MDIPASNCVICFDITPHAVALVQRRGRGRQAGSKFVVLRERADRTTRDLEQMERVQQQECVNFVPPERTPQQLQREREQERTKQLLRDRTAGDKLRVTIAKVGTVSTTNALGILNVVCKQTKVDLAERRADDDEVVLKYQSKTRTCEGRGKGQKKKAKREAAVALVNKLRQELGAVQ